HADRGARHRHHAGRRHEFRVRSDPRHRDARPPRDQAHALSTARQPRGGAPQSVTPAFRNALVWLVGSASMIVAALSSLSAAYVDGHYVPDNEDAFYHARRIIDAVMNHAAVVQFDPKIHAPEGSWLTWPWGFDTLMATITSAFGPFPDVDHLT